MTKGSSDTEHPTPVLAPRCFRPSCTVGSARRCEAAPPALTPSTLRARTCHRNPSISNVSLTDPWVRAVIATPVQIEGFSEPGPRSPLDGWRVNGGVDGAVSDRMIPEMVQAFWAAMAVVAFTAHYLIASSASEGWIRGQLDPDDLLAPMSPRFLTLRADQLGRRDDGIDLLLAARGLG